MILLLCSRLKFTERVCVIFSRKCDYGLRALVYLAERPNTRSVTLADIAEGLHIPRAFLSKILQQLARGGIVRSNKGPTGGFSLRKSPEVLTLQEVVECIEGPISVFDCFADGDCCHQNNCKILDVFDGVSESIRQALGSVILADLVPPKAGAEYDFSNALQWQD